jgi:hypothetical protein
MLLPGSTHRFRRKGLSLALRGPVEEGNEFVDNCGSVRLRRDIGCDQSLSLDAERRIRAESGLKLANAGIISRINKDFLIKITLKVRRRSMIALARSFSLSCVRSRKGARPRVIARSKATKQSILSFLALPAACRRGLKRYHVIVS